MIFTLVLWVRMSTKCDVCFRTKYQEKKSTVQFTFQSSSSLPLSPSSSVIWNWMRSEGTDRALLERQCPSSFSIRLTSSASPVSVFSPVSSVYNKPSFFVRWTNIYFAGTVSNNWQLTWLIDRSIVRLSRRRRRRYHAKVPVSIILQAIEYVLSVRMHQIGPSFP